MPTLDLSESIIIGLLKAFSEQAGPDHPHAVEVFKRTVEHDERELGTGFLFSLGALCGIADQLTPEQLQRALQEGEAAVSSARTARAEALGTTQA